MRDSLALLATLACLVVPPANGAEPAPSNRVVPAVIHDAGGVSIADYLGNVTPDKAIRDRRQAVQQPTNPQPFPVVTTKAQPGLLGAPTRGKLKGGPGVPLCIIGDDPLSKQWLDRNLGVLKAMNAACLVVAISDQTAFERLQARVGSIRLAPGSFDALATASGITVWPVLVSPDGLVSQ
jgi:integrating conjugative element protein (TIGR03765 family)